MKKLAWLFACLAALLAAPAIAQGSAQEPLPPEMQEYLGTLHPQSGKIGIPGAKASLDLGEDYIFYDQQDAHKILTEVWGNPPQAAEGVLGMVMKAGTTPFDDAWGAVISFEDVGYVSDDDAAEVDYDELLTSLKDATRTANLERAKNGYETINLVGWAERPDYDPATHSVVWAKDLQFSGEEGDVLNYDLRTLGRYGVLSVNMVAGMPQLDEVRLAAHELAKHAAFDSGARYADYNAATDRAAEYGIGGLIAAGAGVAAAKKLGILAILLKFIKPILIGGAVVFAALFGRIKRLFGMGDDNEDEGDWQYYEAAEDDGVAISPEVEGDLPATSEAQIPGDPEDDPTRSG